MADFAEISGAQTKIFQVQEHKNISSFKCIKMSQMHLRCSTNSDQVC